jgi:F-type H+-transporting ATPase subunit delta
MADLATIARPYAEALAGTAKPEEMAKWSEQLGSLAHLASNEEVAILSSNPNVSQEQLADLLMAGISGDISPALKKFITLLTLNHRIAALPEISKQFDEIKNARDGSAEVHITTAFPMGEDEVKSLVIVISKRFGNKNLKPTVSIDSELIGGVRVQVGDEVLDTSVKSRLEAMQAALLS